MIKTINGAIFTKMILSAGKLLEANRAKIDALNVFPVPDGDTGTNMSMTMQSAVRELKLCNSNRMSLITDAVSRGALRGARGNSGVILSQVFRGICSELKEKEEIDTRLFAKAMKKSTDVAYSAVSKPKEGTMLTVSRMMSECAQTAQRHKDFEIFFKEVIARGQEALDMTPELLPVLKKAGVVDSGGMGLLTVYRGMLMGLLGEEVPSTPEEDEEQPATPVQESAGVSQTADVLNLGEIEYGYCTEFFIINLKRRTTLADIDKLREYLMGIGDSVLVIGDLEFVKVHVHTNNPGQALSKALTLGELDKVKIENMLEQNRQLIKKYEAEKKEIGMLAIAQGDGIAEIFKELMVDQVIQGGQTMNPSASDIADAVVKINAENIFVFPNNSNIILAAEQAKSLVEGKKIYVVPTKNVPQGFAAALAFNPEASADDNLLNMLHEIENVSTGSVTYASRTTKIDGFSLKKGDIIGLNSKKVLAKATNPEDATLKLIDKIKDKSHGLINLYYGQDVTEAEATELQAKLAEKYPECDVEIYYGGQPIYYYIVSLE
ncbi:MAG: DAK2 domain-containing protein [Candidatus Borkfalkiaceae bacterium]|nr:DAK2 domain-containing protein [Christensenellaceae bacterium]